MSGAPGTTPPRLADKSEIRRRLNTDRDWSLYALTDLDGDMFPHCDWWALDDGLVLVFRAIPIHPIFVLGSAGATRTILAALPETTGYLNLKPDQLSAADGIYRFRERHEMRRMLLDTFQPRPGAVETLTSDHLAGIERLYSSGDGGGIAFAPYQLATGFFRGIRREGELVAVAGVHAASRQEGVAGIGNIFTRPDWRGRGFAQILTSAVVTSLREARIPTIGLNVETTNAPAIRAYEHLGFRTRFSYFEGPADRVPQ